MQTQVRGFLGTCGILHIFIRDFVHITQPLINLTRKDVPFEFEDKHREAMDLLKAAIINLPALRPINYESG